MTTTIMKMISASTAFEVMELPQLGPTNWTFIRFVGTWNAFCRAVCTWSRTVEVSWPVVTCHCCTLPPTYWVDELPPPASETTREISPRDAFLDGNSKIEPPLNSTEKFRLRTASATALIATMQPEIRYHIFWRPTMLTE